jgi:hypothetical protein
MPYCAAGRQQVGYSSLSAALPLPCAWACLGVLAGGGERRPTLAPVTAELDRAWLTCTPGG